MARWDKFLNNLSSGYGVGYARGEQYLAAQRERDNRANLEAAMAAMNQTTPGDPTMTTQTTAVDNPNDMVPIQQADGSIRWVPRPAGIPARAVGGPAPTAAVPAAPAPAPAPHQGVPLRSARNPNDVQARPDPLAAGVRLQAENTGEALDDANAQIAGIYARGQQAIADAKERGTYKEPDTRHPMDIMNENVDAVLGKVKPPEEKKAAVKAEPPMQKGETKAVKTGEVKNEKEAAKQTAEEVLGYVVPSKRMEAVTTFDSDTHPTMAAWDTVRQNLQEIYVRNGDLEGLMTLDSKLQNMQQERMVGHLTKAAQLIEMDPEAAARELYKGYSYYPDGVALDLRMKNGQLVGYGFNEATGKFETMIPLNQNSITRMVEAAQDPVAFQKGLREARSEAEERAWEIATDKRDHALAVFDSKSKHALRLAQALAAQAGAAKDKALGVKAYLDGLGLDGNRTAGLWDSPEKASRYLEGVNDYITDKFTGKGINPNAIEAMVWNDETGIGTRTGLNVAMDVATITPTLRSNAEVHDLTTSLLEAEYMLSNRQGAEKAEDLTAEEIEKRLADVIVSEMPERPGYLAVRIGGREMVVKERDLPGLGRLARNPQQAIAEVATPPVDSTPLPLGARQAIMTGEPFDMEKLYGQASP